jgi:putative membrane protein
VNRRGQAVVLLLVGAAVLGSSITNAYLRYVRPGLRPFLVVAGVLLVVTAVMTLRHGTAGEPPTADRPSAAAESRHDDDHGHGHRQPRVAWLLTLPVFVTLLLAPPALGAYSAARTGTILTQRSNFPPLRPGDPVTIKLSDYASRAAYGHGRTLGDRQVRLTGFLMTGPAGQPYLARMLLVCCAADAGPIKVGLTGHVPVGRKPDTWMEITGRYTARSDKDPVNGLPIPYLDVVTSTPVPTPNEPYES